MKKFITLIYLLIIPLLAYSQSQFEVGSNYNYEDKFGASVTIIDSNIKPLEISSVGMKISQNLFTINTGFSLSEYTLIQYDFGIREDEIVNIISIKFLVPINKSFITMNLGSTLRGYPTASLGFVF